jgi:hypothetical protein
VGNPAYSHRNWHCWSFQIGIVYQFYSEWAHVADKAWVHVSWKNTTIRWDWRFSAIDEIIGQKCNKCRNVRSGEKYDESYMKMDPVTRSWSVRHMENSLPVQF